MFAGDESMSDLLVKLNSWKSGMGASVSVIGPSNDVSRSGAGRFIVRRKMRWTLRWRQRLWHPRVRRPYACRCYECRCRRDVMAITKWWIWSNVCLCAGFRMPVMNDGATRAAFRRPKAAKERTRGRWCAEGAVLVRRSASDLSASKGATGGPQHLGLMVGTVVESGDCGLALMTARRSWLSVVATASSTVAPL